MSKIKSLFRWIPRPLRTKRALIVLIVLVIGYFILTNGAANESLIKYHTVGEKTIKSEITGSGKVKAINNIALHFPVAGKIVYLPVKNGETVEKGTVIASIDRERYEIAVRQAEWDFQAAKAEFDKLYDKARGRGSETFDERIERTAIDASHNKAYDALLKARRDLRDATLTAPFTGKIENVSVQLYEEVLPTTTVAKIIGNDTIEFIAEIDESEIGKISEGQPAEIILDAYPDEEIPATVASIGEESIQTSTGGTAFTVIFALGDGGRYRSGMSGEVRILADQSENTIAVPFEAIIDEKYVHVKTPTGVQKREVKQGISSDVEVEVISGLQKGERIVISGFEELDKKSLLQKIFRL